MYRWRDTDFSFSCEILCLKIEFFFYLFVFYFVVLTFHVFLIFVQFFMAAVQTYVRIFLLDCNFRIEAFTLFVKLSEFCKKKSETRKVIETSNSKICWKYFLNSVLLNFYNLFIYRTPSWSTRPKCVLDFSLPPTVDFYIFSNLNEWNIIFYIVFCWMNESMPSHFQLFCT